MFRSLASTPTPDWRACLQLLKPITWFPPMWAFGCGVVSSGVAPADHWGLIVIGIVLAGPLVCGTSQIVNDWYDREVDAINEPHRPIPSGRVPGSWGLILAVLWSLLSLAVAAALGTWVFVATIIALALAWAYSAPPFRLKRNGWWGNAAVGFSYEGLAWFTGAAALASAFPDWRIVALAVLYSIGAHGIMTLNDFKSVEGDRQLGIGSLPVRLGERRAGLLACWVMAAAQIIVVALLLVWGRPLHALVVMALTLVQLRLMARFLTQPKALAPWYNGTGVMLYVLGMLAAALAVRPLV